MKTPTQQHTAFIACGLLLVLISCALWALTAQIVFASVQPNAKTRLLPLQEWEFSGLNGDGPTSVVIEKKYGFIEVSTTHPR